MNLTAPRYVNVGAISDFVPGASPSTANCLEPHGTWTLLRLSAVRGLRPRERRRLCCRVRRELSGDGPERLSSLLLSASALSHRTRGRVATCAGLAGVDRNAASGRRPEPGPQPGHAGRALVHRGPGFPGSRVLGPARARHHSPILNVQSALGSSRREAAPGLDSAVPQPRGPGSAVSFVPFRAEARAVGRAPRRRLRKRQFLSSS